MIAACVATYGRPRLCSDALWCLTRQELGVPSITVACSDEEAAFMDVVGLCKMTSPVRFPTLGDKRNAMVRYAISLGATEIAICDDDDLYTQGHLAHVHAGLQEHDVFFPRQHWVCREDRRWELDLVHTKPWTLHSGAGFRAETFLEVGGYPAQDWSEDFRLMHAMVGWGRTYGTVDHRPTFIRRVFDSSQHHTSRRKSLVPDRKRWVRNEIHCIASDHAQGIVEEAERSA